MASMPVDAIPDLSDVQVIVYTEYPGQEPRVVEDQVDRLLALAAAGFAVGLAILYLFLGQWRAVLVVAIAVPVSLLGALTLLHASGQTLNLISLFGLAVGVGLLVDNSVVVYEAVQRSLAEWFGK